MRLTVRRISVGAVNAELLVKAEQAAAGGPPHRSNASPHSRGGAPYAVTHSRRKYHNACMRFVARSLP